MQAEPTGNTEKMPYPLFPHRMRQAITLLRAGFVLSFLALILNVNHALIVFLLFTGVLGVIMGWGMFVPNSQIFGFVFSRGDPQSRKIALTFDDGPSSSQTPQVLDILKEFGVTATFFVVGTKAGKHGDLVRRMVIEGHDVENHTWKHPPTQAVFPLYYTRKIKRELKRCSETVSQFAGNNPGFVRFPAGIKSLPLMKAACELRLIVTGFSVRAFDSSGSIDGETVFKRVKSRMFPGAIVVLHDGKRCGSRSEISPTVDALPRLLKFFRDQEYQCVTIRQLFDDYLQKTPGLKGIAHE